MSAKVYTSWSNIENLCDKLCDKMKKATFKPDLIVGISRGGLIPGVLISHRLDLPFEPLMHSTRDFLAHDPSKIFDLCEEIAENNISILILDDICDTGKTFQDINEYFVEQGVGRDNVRWGSLHLREGAAFTPDFFGELITTDGWIVYPYEVDNE